MSSEELIKNDEYLSLIYDEYNKGKLSKDDMVKKATMYLVRLDCNLETIDGVINILTRSNVDEKRVFLSKITLDGTELKYGSIVNDLPDEKIEKLYNMERKLADDKKNDIVHVNKAQDIYIQKKNDIMSDVEISEDEMPEVNKSSIVYDKIAGNLKNEEESTVRVVELSKDREEKLKESKNKINKKKFLIEMGLFVTACLCVSPVNAVLSSLELAAIAYVVKNGRYEPKTKAGNALKTIFNGLVDFYNPIEKEERTK